MQKTSIALAAVAITALVLGVALVIELLPEDPTPLCYTEEEQTAKTITPGFTDWDRFNISFLKVGMVSVDFSANLECTSGPASYVRVYLYLNGSEIWNVQVEFWEGLTPINHSQQFPALAAGHHYVAIRLYGDMDGYIQNTTLRICFTAS